MNAVASVPYEGKAAAGQTERGPRRERLKPRIGHNIGVRAKTSTNQHESAPSRAQHTAQQVVYTGDGREKCPPPPPFLLKRQSWLTE